MLTIKNNENIKSSGQSLQQPNNSCHFFLWIINGNIIANVQMELRANRMYTKYIACYNFTRTATIKQKQFSNEVTIEAVSEGKDNDWFVTKLYLSVSKGLNV